MISQVSSILESDVTEANDKMLGKNSADKKNTNNEMFIILFAILIFGLAAYFEEKRNKEQNKMKIKYDNGETKEIDLNVTESEIERALETLKNKK